MNILKIKELVHKILKDHLMARSEDNVLVGLVWHHQLNQIGYRGCLLYTSDAADE